MVERVGGLGRLMGIVVRISAAVVGGAGFLRWLCLLVIGCSMVLASFIVVVSAGQT